MNYFLFENLIINIQFPKLHTAKIKNNDFKTKCFKETIKLFCLL